MSSQYVRLIRYPLLVHHVVRMLGVSARTVRYWASRGTLPAIKSGPKIWCFRIEDVQQFAAQLGRPLHGLNLCMDARHRVLGH
jgi:excisionase family DNA binding protein